jgi:ribosomal protein L34E
VESLFEEKIKATKYVYPDYESGTCVYCGEMSDTVDHLLPVTWTGKSARKRVPVVPACQECNSTLGAIYLPSVEERRMEVHRKYKRKYRKVLTMTVLTEEGLDSFGPNIRLMVNKLHKEHYRTMRRLAWPLTATYDLDAWENAWEI